MPRLWRGLGNLGHPGVMMPFARYVDGDVTHLPMGYQFRPRRQQNLQRVSIPLTQVRRCRWSDSSSACLRPRPRICLANLGKITSPRQGELSASLHGEQIPTEDIGQFTYNTRYVPLDEVLERIEGNLVAPIEITFPLEYFRYVRWRSFPDNGQGPFFDQAEGVLTIAKLAYAEFELYGRGFAAESRYESKVVDLRQPAILGQVAMAVSKWRRQEGQMGRRATLARGCARPSPRTPTPRCECASGRAARTIPRLFLYLQRPR